MAALAGAECDHPSGPPHPRGASVQAEPLRFASDLDAREKPTDLAGILRRLANRPEHRGALTHWHTLPARPARFQDLSTPLADPAARALAALGITRLYLHQARAIETLRGGRDVVVVTGTASGKSLCYHLPVLERLAADPEATALYLFPTKALAQDQLKGLMRLAAGHPDLLKRMVAGVYDGDTPPTTRRKLRDSGNVILSNPDMLHQGILPSHPKWARFLSRLAFVVIDEMHAYRGIFGSHVANVLRRLERITTHYGARFAYALCSATIRNPGELSRGLTGRGTEVVDEDGAPRGPKHFVFWNPPFVDDSRMERRSTNGDGSRLLAELVASGAQAIAFTKSRVAAELVFRYARETLGRTAPELADRLRPYRGGYLPEERRGIERALFSGDLAAVISTNALELGIDVGSLDAAILIGAPPTLASAWQQAGRAGRQGDPSMAVLVAYNEMVDQYLMRHPEYFFGRSPEAAVIDAENPYILAQQLACAAYELPLAADEDARFGGQTKAVLEALESTGETRSYDGRAYWASAEFPAAKVNLRTISDDTYSIVDVRAGHSVIGTVDAISGLELVYPDAVYLHDGATYFVRELDLEQKVAYVEPREVGYYTQPVVEMQIRARAELRQRDWRRETVRLGEVTYAWQTIAMKKVKFGTREAIGYHPLSLPRLTLDTVGFWLAPSAATWAELARRGAHPWGALAGVRNLAVTLLSMMTMCDPSDLQGVLDSANLGSPTLFLFDRYPGGLGFSEQGFARVDELALAALDHVRACPCDAGCPSCVGLPVLRPAQQQDPDLSHARAVPSKDAARALLEIWCRRETSA
ncbi:MAG: DEAD/DEAH box helicase [Candidatus Eisenbacteria bacterium]|uniref:DEAD/DEAH box helicase n=1 Tax=Eiseniibacteriota bacterium TaxID=2212470 RepID=A0A538U412_UNCEI|nr:MAG: DEAD/DEAH box helicase [Candidatus Eisenbacteria bacterium]